MNSDFLSIIIIAVGLSADCFAVALAGACSMNHSWRRILLVALSFGLFQAFMPVLGWLAGKTVVGLISSYDHWIAFGLLGFVGGKMLVESLRHSDDEKEVTDITRGWTVITMSIATSIDALAVGLSFAFLSVNIAFAGSIIGVVAMVVTTIGFVVGRRAGKLIGKRAETLGGSVLIAIAFRILLSHLLA
jgi:putative Mn2+ efflux pump MntP